MSDFYTSYETSLALRDAGAPQGDYTDAECYYCSACGKEYLGTPENGWRRLDPIEGWCGCGVHRTHARAFRADEIIEALVARGALNSIRPPEQILKEWRVEVRFDPSGMHGLAVYEPTLVEALAAAWLAVLKEGKK